MKITILQIQNIRSFVDESVEFSPGINVIVGMNNSGKTTLLNCASMLQNPRLVSDNYKRINSSLGTIRVWVDQGNAFQVNPQVNNFFTQTNMGDIQGRQGEQVLTQLVGIPNQEPENFIIPYQSKRKVGGYSEGITIGVINQVNGNLSNLYAKIDRISNPEFQPAYSEYVEACDMILGFRVTTTNSDGGKKAAYIIRNEQNIPIDMMGEGVPNLLGLIVDLCRVENKLFIIEEPENDIHPAALKSLLDLIAKKSVLNQFIITTHSNVVLRHLGSIVDARVFNVEMKFQDKIPTSSVVLLDTQEKRQRALEELGYEFFDYDMWNYWIFFEEASAEAIFRDFLIPWFAPRLKGKVRTFSARTVEEIAPKFDDFNRLFVFLHLQEAYTNKVWVLIDSGDHEAKIINQLREKYIPRGWNSQNFQQFSKHDFEEYYPGIFSEEVAEVLRISDKQQKRLEKRKLLEKVIKFCRDDEKEAEASFQQTAEDLIGILRQIK